MKDREWVTIDKRTWPDGPWKSEPDKEQWTDPDTGLPCLLKRNGSGALCGYVGVTEGHPWFAKDYEHVEPHPEVHGGLTYADFCQEGEDGNTICHIVEPGEPDRVWWLGFDCAHLGDLCPQYEHIGHERHTYRTRAYVKSECALLAKQIKEAAHGHQ